MCRVLPLPLPPLTSRLLIFACGVDFVSTMVRALRMLHLSLGEFLHTFYSPRLKGLVLARPCINACQ